VRKYEKAQGPWGAAVTIFIIVYVIAWLHLLLIYLTLWDAKIFCPTGMSVIYRFCLCHAVYTADVLFLSLHLCRFMLVFGFSVRFSAKAIGSPVAYTKQLFDNYITAIFVFKNIFCVQNLKHFQSLAFFILNWRRTKSFGFVAFATGV
jgi:hypothetical protein